jgi:hypothetical protein
MDDALRQSVRRRAGERCEFCHLPQSGHEERFSIDHVVPRKHRGGDLAENLAFSCLRCNLHKGTDLSGIDPGTHSVVALFNPRQQRWREHFRWKGPILVGITPTGRATVELLRMNVAERVRLREALLAERTLKLD